VLHFQKGISDVQHRVDTVDNGFSKQDDVEALSEYFLQYDVPKSNYNISDAPRYNPPSLFASRLVWFKSATLLLTSKFQLYFDLKINARDCSKFKETSQSKCLLLHDLCKKTFVFEADLAR
jgi:hypothetical protein